MHFSDIIGEFPLICKYLASAEPLVGVDGVLLELLQVVVVLQLSLLPDLAGQPAHVGELPPLAVRVDVAVLAPGDAVHAARLLPEGAVLGDVAEGEGAVLVLVAVALYGAHGGGLLRALRAAGPAEGLLVLEGLLLRARAAAGNGGRLAGAAGGGGGALRLGLGGGGGLLNELVLEGDLHRAGLRAGAGAGGGAGLGAGGRTGLGAGLGDHKGLLLDLLLRKLKEHIFSTIF